MSAAAGRASSRCSSSSACRSASSSSASASASAASYGQPSSVHSSAARRQSAAIAAAYGSAALGGIGSRCPARKRQYASSPRTHDARAPTAISSGLRDSTVAKSPPTRRSSHQTDLRTPQGRVYDRIGRLQDLQALVERPAIDDLVAHADFEHARAVFELGYGTGALARRLFEKHLPAEARYLGVDVSPHMHELARRRLAPFADRAELRLSDGSLRFPLADGVFDRFLSCYVLDLLARADIDLVLSEARRLLAPHGLLCLTSLSPGATGAAQVVTRVWRMVWKLRPELLGGCRPIRIADHLDPAVWAIRHQTVITRLGFSFAVVVATPPLP